MATPIRPLTPENRERVLAILHFEMATWVTAFGVDFVRECLDDVIAQRRGTTDPEPPAAGAVVVPFRHTVTHAIADGAHEVYTQCEDETP